MNCAPAIRGKRLALRRKSVRREAPRLARVARRWVAGSLVVAGAALAAVPKANGLYIGTIPGTSKQLQIHVTKDGKFAIAAVYCSRTRADVYAHLPKFSIVNGKFAATHGRGPNVVWAIAGHFVSSTQTIVSMNLHQLCDGKGGTVTLRLSGS